MTDVKTTPPGRSSSYEGYRTPLPDHPLRRQLHDELHARPSLYFEAPAVVWHAAFVAQGQTPKMPDVFAEMDAKTTRDGKSGIADCRDGKVKWEVHNEFVSLTRVVPWTEDAAVPPAPDAVWQRLMRSMPGERIASVEVYVVGADRVRPDEFLGAGGDVIASRVGGGDAEVRSTFRLGEDGTMRILMTNHQLNAYRTGRMVRRLLEIEHYRMMALLGHPLSQEAFVRCAEFEARLQAIMTVLGSATGRQDELLRDVARLSADILDFSARTRTRFGATAAYADLVFRRLAELREERVEGHQRIGVFVDRRFRPAVRACEQASERVEGAAIRVARASELLRTSVQVELEQQNALLLESVERRVAVQTKVQEAVEGFSIIAISYYALGIVKLLLESVGEVYGDVHWIKSVLIVVAPLVIASVWFAVRRARSSMFS